MLPKEPSAGLLLGTKRWYGSGQWRQHRRPATTRRFRAEGVDPARTRRSITDEIDYMAGCIVRVVGDSGLVIPVFRTSQTKDVVNLGRLKIQSTAHSTHVAPQTLSAGVLVLGVVLIGAGLTRGADSSRASSNPIFMEAYR